MLHPSFLARCGAVLLILAGCSEPSLPDVKPWILEDKVHFAAKSVLCCKKVVTLNKRSSDISEWTSPVRSHNKFNEEWLVVLQSQLIIIC